MGDADEVVATLYDLAEHDPQLAGGLERAGITRRI